MTYPRRLLVRPGRPGVYHCVSRCVRRAYLCGKDHASKRSYEHRRRWVEDRILALADVFAVAVHAYAVMSNHFHVVIEVMPRVAEAWSDREVALRWTRLFPSRDGSEGADDRRIDAALSSPERIAALRDRLCDLAWFMRCLNEPIARRANREDKCIGRFWEGRYKCQALLDDRAVLAAMAYVDLNPIRAGLTRRLDRSAHTSIQRRLRTMATADRPATGPMAPIAGAPTNACAVDERSYVELVDWSGRQMRPGKKGAIPRGAPSALSRIGVEPDMWPLHVKATGSSFWRAVGTAQALLDTARAMGQHWLRGVGTARAMAAS